MTLIINLFYENKKLTKCSKLRPCKEKWELAQTL